jgi:hypothetical protein
MESMSGDMWKPPWCVLDPPSLHSELPIINSSPSMLLRLLTLMLTYLQFKVQGEDVLTAGGIGFNRFSPRFTLTYQARYLTNSRATTICVSSLTSLHVWRPMSDEGSISTNLDTSSLSNSVVSSTMMCKLDPRYPATTTGGRWRQWWTSPT